MSSLVVSVLSWTGGDGDSVVQKKKIISNLGKLQIWGQTEWKVSHVLSFSWRRKNTLDIWIHGQTLCRSFRLRMRIRYKRMPLHSFVAGRYILSQSGMGWPTVPTWQWPVIPTRQAATQHLVSVSSEQTFLVFIVHRDMWTFLSPNPSGALWEWLLFSLVCTSSPADWTSLCRKHSLRCQRLTTETRSSLSEFSCKRIHSCHRIAIHNYLVVLRPSFPTCSLSAASVWLLSLWCLAWSASVNRRCKLGITYKIVLMSYPCWRAWLRRSLFEHSPQASYSSFIFMTLWPPEYELNMRAVVRRWFETRDLGIKGATDLFVLLDVGRYCNGL